MATIEQVRDKAGSKLGIITQGQTLSSDKSADIDAAYVELHARLDVVGLAPWGDEESDVPDEFVKYVVDLLAFDRADDYSIPNDKYQRIALSAAVAENGIRKLIATNKTTKTEMQYF